jgi:hypothetical protein
MHFAFIYFRSRLFSVVRLPVKLSMDSHELRLRDGKIGNFLFFTRGKRIVFSAGSKFEKESGIGYIKRPVSQVEK